LLKIKGKDIKKAMGYTSLVKGVLNIALFKIMGFWQALILQSE